MIFIYIFLQSMKMIWKNTSSWILCFYSTAKIC